MGGHIELDDEEKAWLESLLKTLESDGTLPTNLRAKLAGTSGGDGRKARIYAYRLSNGQHLALAAALMAAGMVSLPLELPKAAGIVVVSATYAYLLTMILSIAMRPLGGPRPNARWCKRWFQKRSAEPSELVEPLVGVPDRLPAMFVLSCLFVAFVCAFADLYLLGGVERDGRALNGIIEAVYYSVITIATVGYGDFVPVDKWSRIFAISEVLAGGLMLITGFGMLASRLAAFEE